MMKNANKAKVNTNKIKALSKTVRMCGPQYNKIKNQKVFYPKLIILEGFRQNGYQIRIQRKKLRISTLVKIDFGHFLKTYSFVF